MESADVGVGDCVEVLLSEIWRFADIEATLIEVLARPCEINPKFLKRVTKMLMDRDSPTGYDQDRRAEDVYPQEDLGEVP